MNPNTIRKIDFWFGRPICFILTGIKKILPSSFFSEKTVVKRILFLKFIEQGATILAFGSIKRATEIAGKENVYFCVFDNNRPILDILDVIPAENIIAIQEGNFFSFLSSAFSALIKIRKVKINTVIDMEFFSRASAIFSFLSGAKIRVGLHRFTSELPYRGNLMTHRVQYNPYLHTSVLYYLLIEASLQNPGEVPMMKIPCNNFSSSLPAFIPSEEEKNSMLKKIEAALLLFDRRIDYEVLVLLNPNASDLLPLRKWESEKFVLLGKKILSENKNARIVITGASSEQVSSEEICKHIDSPKAVSLAGKTTLRELLVLYYLSDILITNDSGPGHFASLTKIKTIILFGPETPKLFGPVSPSAHVIWKKLACSPCVNVFNHRFSPCNNNICMQSISVDEVYAGVKKLLEKLEKTG